MKRALAVVLITFGCVVAFVQLHRFYSRKFYVTTGKGKWIWDQHRLASERPVVFFATRDFTLPPNRQYVRIKVAADPEYVLYFNGVQLGGRRFRGSGVIDRYEATSYARDGRNRIVVAVRSAKGVGGLIVGVDLAPLLENIIVSDHQWRIYRLWSNELLQRDPPELAFVRPQILGQPPVGRWDYLNEIDAQPPRQRTIMAPRDVIEFTSSLPVITVASGVAVASSRVAMARAFDFGPVRGRARIEVQPIGSVVVRIRYANDPSEFIIAGEIIPLPVARGEQVVVDSELRRFRYIIVYDIDARATVLVE